MKALVIASRNNFWEKNLVAEVEAKIQAIGCQLADDPTAVDAAVVISDGRDLPAAGKLILKKFLKNKQAVKPHRLLAIYHIADAAPPAALVRSADFVTKEIYSLIGCLKDYLFFSNKHGQENG